MIAFARMLVGIDPEEIALWGTSFSGGHVIATAARDRSDRRGDCPRPGSSAGWPRCRAAGLTEGLKLTREGLIDELHRLRGAEPRGRHQPAGAALSAAARLRGEARRYPADTSLGEAFRAGGGRPGRLPHDAPAGNDRADGQRRHDELGTANRPAQGPQSNSNQRS